MQVQPIWGANPKKAQTDFVVSAACITFADKRTAASMYTVIKRMEVSASHHLNLSYRSKCENLHGHNWIITVYCRSKELNADGMVVDFSHLKQIVKEQLDHRNFNEVLPFNPTAENIARWICDQIPTCYRVEVCESEHNTAIYEKD